MIKNKIFRIRQKVVSKGNEVLFEADVITQERRDALIAGLNDKILGWRVVDSKKSNKSDSIRIYFVKEVSPEQAKSPKQPLL